MRKALINFLGSVVLLMLVFSSLVTKTYALWDNTETSNIQTIIIGEWEFIPAWDSTITYLKGDIVTYNGIQYIALRNVPAGKIPGRNGSKKFWRLN